VAPLGELRAFARFAKALPAFLGSPLDGEAARAAIAERLRSREASFLRVLQRGVYEQRRSPYRALLDEAGVELGDVAGLVSGEGLEPTLERLYDAGVRVSLEEFKGRAREFDNPLLTRHYETRSGGSRGARRRIFVDLELSAHDAAYHRLFLEGFGLLGRPMVMWYPAPPGVAGIGSALSALKAGREFERWFSQSGQRALRPAVLTAVTVAGARLSRRRLPAPRRLPPARAAVIASWLAERRAEGAPGVLYSTPSSGVRVCAAARESGLDISGSMLRFGGEPFTPAKAAIVGEAGCETASNYFMAEAGWLGVACPDAREPDDVHLVSDKIALVQREPGGTLHATGLSGSTGKLMLNVDTGDQATMERRDCGCPVGELGLRDHLHTIRSHEKLTSEGMSFLGTDVLALVEEVLPARFGGEPTDWQLVEEEVAGLSRVCVVASPRLTGLDEQTVVETVLEALARAGAAQGMMAEVWRVAETLRVVRREPYVTEGSKTLALHVVPDAVSPRRARS
jgi:hypothetical protein